MDFFKTYFWATIDTIVVLGLMAGLVWGADYLSSRLNPDRDNWSTLSIKRIKGGEDLSKYEQPFKVGQ